MSAQLQPYVEIDGFPFPLVGGSQVQRNPLSPFSPSPSSGATSRITDSRLAVEVWSDFTGGLGQRDESSAQNTSYAEGNMDTRVAGAAALPPLPTLLGTLAASAADTPILVDSMRGGPTATSLLLWSRKSTLAYSWRNGILTSTGGTWSTRASAQFAGAFFTLEWLSPNSRIRRSTDAWATITVPHTSAAKSYRGLVAYDNRLVTYNETDNLFLSSIDGTTWANFDSVASGLPLYQGEVVSQLFTWIAPGGNRFAVYALTNYRVFGYEDEANQWHEYFSYEGIFNATYANAYMYRRDSNIYIAPDDDVTAAGADTNAAVLMFTPGTADEVGPTKRFGLPATEISGIFRMQGGVHWLYAFASGNQGGIYALNEFGGWTTMFDAATVDTGTATLIGGGYANGKLWAVLSNGNLYEMLAPDRRELPPRSDGSTYHTAACYLRSSWTSHNQENRVKLGAFFQIDMRRQDGISGVPLGSVVTFRYRMDNQPWVTIPLGATPTNDYIGMLALQSVHPSTTVWPAIVLLPDGVQQQGAAYTRVQWEVTVQRSSPATDTPVLASVALYYIFWTPPHYAYQFNIDLSAATFAEWQDGSFGGFSRDELLATLLSFNEAKTFHTLRLGAGSMEEYVPACDILVSARQDADDGGGIFSITMRDLTADR